MTYNALMDTRNAPPPLTFFLPGISKCGTTTLSEMLARHPDLLLPTVREPWYLSKEHADRDWSEYWELFPRVADYAAVGDDSTDYTSHLTIDMVSERISRYFPEARIVILVRNPITRIESSFREVHNSGPQYGFDAPFELSEAMIEWPQLIEDTRYGVLIRRYLDRFEHVHILFTEDLVAHPKESVSAVFQFLGLDPARCPDYGVPQLNPGVGKLVDTRVLRRLRNHPLVGPRLARIPVPTQDRWLSRAGLRRRFTQKVDWDDKAQRLFRERVQPDTVAFAEQMGRVPEAWNRSINPVFDDPA